MPNLIIAAYWTDEKADLATAKLGASINGHIADSGGVVSIADKNVDVHLRVFLRRLQLEEAANWRRNAAAISDRRKGRS
jgi:hypothetical protein